MNRIIENQVVFDYLLVVGDTHGENKKLYNHLLPNIPTEEKKAILHCGDFGIGFSTHTGELDAIQHLDMKCKQNNVWLYVIRGNHDNPAYFDTKNLKYHDMDKFDNIIFIPDHTLLTLEFADNKTKNIYCLGGAISVDRVLRTPSKSYWWDEIVPELTEEQLEDIPSNIDIVLTHTRPIGVFPIDKSNITLWLNRDKNLEYDLDLELERITNVFDKLYAKNPEGFAHYYGHFHMSNREQIGNVKHILLNIDELVEHRI